MKFEGYELTFVKARLDLDPGKFNVSCAKRTLAVASDSPEINSVDLLSVK